MGIYSTMSSRQEMGARNENGMESASPKIDSELKMSSHIENSVNVVVVFM
jgi:hypothetical protein